MAYLERGRRVGRSQAASIFWGLVSVFFAAAACFYFLKNHENETSANVLRDQVLRLQEQRESLSSEKDKLQSDMSQSEVALKTREDFLQDKEAKLAEEETQLDALSDQSQSQSQQSESQAGVVKKFNDAVHKMAKDPDTDVVVRGGRPVLRVPSSVFFAYGDATLKPEGKAMLSQLAQALNGQMDKFELRVETFTDSGGETIPASDPAHAAGKTDAGANATPDTPAMAAPVPSRFASGWDLTGARAAALAQYLREKTPLPFQNVIVVPRADYQPIADTGGKDGHARNRRIEMTITPLPVAYHPVAGGPTPTNGNTVAQPKTVAKAQTKPPAKPAPKTPKTPPVIQPAGTAPRTKSKGD